MARGHKKCKRLGRERERERERKRPFLISHLLSTHTHMCTSLLRLHLLFAFSPAHPHTRTLAHFAHSRTPHARAPTVANLLVFFIYTFMMSAVAISLPISNGLVTPAFALGAAFGACVRVGARV